MKKPKKKPEEQMPETKQEQTPEKAPDPNRVATRDLIAAFESALVVEELAEVEVKRLVEADDTLENIVAKAKAKGDAGIATAQRQVAAHHVSARYFEGGPGPFSLDVGGVRYRCLRPKVGSVYRLSSVGETGVSVVPE